MSLNELRGKGKDECGYTCIKPPAVDETNSSVYQFATNIATNIRTESSRFAATFSPGILSKKRLTTLSIQSIKRNVEQITELSHINPNGSLASIQKWARLAFHDRTMGAIDETQQRAFEVITSIFVLIFHDEAERNENTTGITLEPRS